MANKRVSELLPINASELQTQDLLLLSDVSEHQSKRLQLGDISSYILSDGNLTASIYGTSSWASFAVYALGAPLPVSVSYASSSTWATNSETSSLATDSLDALSSSYSLSSSYILTASYAATTSVILSYSAAYSDQSISSSYLTYVTGAPNGTASFSISSSYVTQSTHSNTASFSVTASYSGTSSVSTTASYGVTASYAKTASYIPISGIIYATASYALESSLPTTRVDYGIFNSITQSTYSAQLDNVYFSSSTNYTSITATGTAELTVLKDVAVNGLIELKSRNRWSGITQSIDSTPIYSLSNYSGSIKVPFTLMGDFNSYKQNIVYITASSGVTIDTSRAVKFKISNLGGVASVLTTGAEETDFIAISSSVSPPPLIYFTSSGVNLSGSDADVRLAGLDTITDIKAYSCSLDQTKYVWSMKNLKTLDFSYNPDLTDVGGFPNSLVTMSVQHCSLTELAPLTYISASILDCSNNSLTVLPALPPTMSYINCSNNLLNILPSSLPHGITEFLAYNNSIPAVPPALPTSLVTMSIYNNSPLSYWTTPLPSSLGYFDCSYTGLQQITTLPSGMLNLDVSYCDMTVTAIENICSQLVAGALNNGTLNVSGNGIVYSSASLSSITTLQSRGWSVTS